MMLYSIFGWFKGGWKVGMGGWGGVFGVRGVGLWYVLKGLMCNWGGSRMFVGEDVDVWKEMFKKVSCLWERSRRKDLRRRK